MDGTRDNVSEARIKSTQYSLNRINWLELKQRGKGGHQRNSTLYTYSRHLGIVIIVLTYCTSSLQVHTVVDGKPSYTNERPVQPTVSKIRYHCRGEQYTAYTKYNSSNLQRHQCGSVLQPKCGNSRFVPILNQLAYVNLDYVGQSLECESIEWTLMLRCVENELCVENRQGFHQQQYLILLLYSLSFKL